MSIAVEATISRVEKVTISDYELERLVIETLMKAGDIRHFERLFIRDGKLYNKLEQCGGSHCWFDDIFQRDVKETDEHFIKVLNVVREYFQNKRNK